MPLLRFYGVGLPLVRGFARELTETLAGVVKCPQDWFHLEVSLGRMIEARKLSLCLLLGLGFVVMLSR